jgi:hypothetical protein
MRMRDQQTSGRGVASSVGRILCDPLASSAVVTFPRVATLNPDRRD